LTVEHWMKSLPGVPFTVPLVTRKPLTLHEVAASAGELRARGAMMREAAQRARTVFLIMRPVTHGDESRATRHDVSLVRPGQPAARTAVTAFLAATRTGSHTGENGGA